MQNTRSEQMAAALAAVQAYVEQNGLMDEFGDVVAFGERLLDRLRTFEQAVEADEQTQLFTRHGITQRMYQHAESTGLIEQVRYAETVALEIDRRARQGFEDVWRQLTTPPGDVLEYLRLREMRERLQALDPVNRNAVILQAARSGQREDILRAALTAPTVAFESSQDRVGDLSDDLLRDVREAVRERLSPMGADAFRASTYRQFATLALAVLDAHEEPLASMARTGAVEA